MSPYLTLSHPDWISGGSSGEGSWAPDPPPPPPLSDLTLVWDWNSYIERIVYHFLTDWLFLMKQELHFATKLNSSDIQKCNCFSVPPMICSPLLAKLYFPRHWRPVFKNWEKRGRLCFLSWSTIMAQEEDVPRVHPLRVEFKYTVRGQGIITCNRDWWEGVWGRSNLPQKISTALSEPKFEPPPPRPQ